ncbi:MAG: putative transporter periplasmic substrate-binding protein [Betaproteobacteria bacterium]|nr:putative transporter periplasmic substrate-binding protein [Betaproteobacteria bacterium]
MPKPLRIIAFPGAPNLPLFAAIKQGYFEQEGLQVALTTTPSSVYQIQAFHAGEFDIAFTACDNIVAYREGQGAAKLEGEVDFRVLMGATQVELSVIVDKSIAEARDLKGKSLALDAVGTGFAFVCYEMLAQLGLDMSEYERVAVGATPERWQSVKEGKHVGTITIEPFTSIAKAAGYRVLRQSTEAFPVYQGGIVAGKQAWIAENGESVRAFIKGYLRGLEWTLAPENRAAAAQLLQAEMPEIKPGVVDAVMNSLLSPRSGLTPKGAILRDGMKTVLDLRSRYGKGGVALSDIDKYLDLSHYDAVIAKL